MKKILLFVCTFIAIAGLLNLNNANAKTNYVVPKAPYVSPALKPCIAKYKQENYTGAMQDLEELIKKEKNNTLAKYYLALCYTRLGYKEEAQTLYKEVVEKDDNVALTHYSQRALDCLEDPNSTKCEVPKVATKKQEEELDDISKFIRSGKKIHPAAMDRITKERMERKLQESEYIRKQQESQALPLKSDASLPTNEEIASALNTLSKIGINPFYQNQTAYNLNPTNLPLNQINPMMLLNNNNMYGAMLGSNQNPELTKMLLLNSLTNQQNNYTNYGI